MCQLTKSFSLLCQYHEEQLVHILFDAAEGKLSKARLFQENSAFIADVLDLMRNCYDQHTMAPDMFKCVTFVLNHPDVLRCTLRRHKQWLSVRFWEREFGFDEPESGPLI